MTLTIWGTVARLGGIVEVRAASGRLASAYAIDHLDARLDDIALTLDHDGHERVGRVVYVEVGERDQVAAVCVVADDELASIDGPVFYSGEYLTHGSRPATGSFISERARMVGQSHDEKCEHDGAGDPLSNGQRARSNRRGRLADVMAGRRAAPGTRTRPHRTAPQRDAQPQLADRRPPLAQRRAAAAGRREGRGAADGRASALRASRSRSERPLTTGGRPHSVPAPQSCLRALSGCASSAAGSESPPLSPHHRTFPRVRLARVGSQRKTRDRGTPRSRRHLAPCR